MNQSLYSYALYIALPLMLFFGFHMLFARVPEKKVFANYLRSRRLMGCALLVLAANYSVHLFLTLRLKDVAATILMNQSTYFLCYWLFCSAMMILMDNQYVTRRRFILHLVLWLVYSALAFGVSLFASNSIAERVGMISLSIGLITYGLWLSVRLLLTYRKAIRMFENTQSDDIGLYIRWMSFFTYWAILFGVSCGLLTFLPNEYIYIWILSSIPFYIYLYCCYQNYVLFYEQVETAFQEDLLTESLPNSLEETPAYHSDMGKSLEVWVGKEGFRQPGITLHELSNQLCTNRTYLSSYINSVYHVSFRDWISDMRVEYAKNLMMTQAHIKLQEVSDQSGFQSLSHFARTFKSKEGCSPSVWRKQQQMERLHTE